MTKFSNGLSDSQRERLDLLAEELCEVGQIIGKINRHGYDSYNPYDEKKTKNRALLEKEIGHALYALVLLVYREDIDQDNIAKSVIKKGSTISKYLHHQDTFDITILEAVLNRVNARADRTG